MRRQGLGSGSWTDVSVAGGPGGFEDVQVSLMSYLASYVTWITKM